MFLLLLLSLLLVLAAVSVWRQPATTDAQRWRRCRRTGALLLAAVLVAQFAA